MLDYQAIGGRIRANRKAHRLTQAALGKAVGLSTAFIGHIERGTRKASLETICTIAETLDVSLDLLLTGSLKMDMASLLHARKRKMLEDMLRILDEHSDEWMPSPEM